MSWTPFLQQRAINLNNGENPACGAMTSGFVFRVENPATVFYLQRVGRTGHLTEVKVSELRDKDRWYMFFSSHTATTISAIAYIIAILWASAVIVLMALARDFWGLCVVGIFVFARFCNVIIIRRRARVVWTGKAEPGVRGDLLVLLTQDRWVRMRGYVDDLKAVTSGQWLQDENTFEGWVNAFKIKIHSKVWSTPSRPFSFTSM